MTTITINRAIVEQALEALEAFLSDELRPYEAAKTSDALRAELAQQAEPVGTRALIEECLAAFAQELAAWDIDPPLHHVKQAHDKCEAWLAAPPQQAEPVEPVARLNKKISFNEAMRLKDQMPKGLFRRVDGQAADEIWLCAIEVAELHHGITDPQIADHLARHGIPMPEGDPK